MLYCVYTSSFDPMEWYYIEHITNMAATSAAGLKYRPQSNQEKLCILNHYQPQVPGCCGDSIMYSSVQYSWILSMELASCHPVWHQELWCDFWKLCALLFWTLCMALPSFPMKSGNEIYFLVWTLLNAIASNWDSSKGLLCVGPCVSTWTRYFVRWHHAPYAIGLVLVGPSVRDVFVGVCDVWVASHR